MIASDVNNSEFLSIGNFASMSLEPDYSHLPDDKDLLYPIQASIDIEKLDNNIFKRAEKYREGVYVWLADGGKIEDVTYKLDEKFMQEEFLRLEAEEKALEQLKKRLNALGLKWMNKEKSQMELERLLSDFENRKQTLDDLETAQWHYMCSDAQ